jgi:hypothetical protein
MPTDFCGRGVQNGVHRGPNDLKKNARNALTIGISCIMQDGNLVGLANRRLQPLGHLSIRLNAFEIASFLPDCK